MTVISWKADEQFGADRTSGRPGGWAGRLQGILRRLMAEVAKFGTVGAIAYVIGLYVYNLLRTGVWPVAEAPLAGKPLLSKVISTAVAMVVAWLGNRYWTFRHRRRSKVGREVGLFLLMNAGGLLIALGCLWISHYAFGLTSALADNISGNFVGDLALGTLFRFWTYRTFVFAEPAAEPLLRPAPREPVTTSAR